MGITSAWHISHSGTTYPAGSVITDLPESDEEKLVADGMATYIEADEMEYNGKNPLTLEAFTELNASAQKDHLQLLGQPTGSNEKERVALYAAWIQEQGM